MGQSIFRIGMDLTKDRLDLGGYELTKDPLPLSSLK